MTIIDTGFLTKLEQAHTEATRISACIKTASDSVSKTVFENIQSSLLLGKAEGNPNQTIGTHNSVLPTRRIKIR